MISHHTNSSRRVHERTADNNNLPKLLPDHYPAPLRLPRSLPSTDQDEPRRLVACKETFMYERHRNSIRERLANTGMIDSNRLALL